MLKDAYRISGRGTCSGALSTFPKNVGRSMLLFYSNPGDVVFDPFAGHNSRMDLCITNGRHYIGCDLSASFMVFNKKRSKILRKKYPNTKIQLHTCDSRKIPIEDDVGDFTITSPPYYDIEFYGDEAGQLGKSKTYNLFLQGIQLVMNENLRILKRDSFAVWFVNDFRRKGKFYLYHMDVARIARKSGFKVHDIFIVDFGKGIRDVFVNQAISTRIIPKRHEYGLVFRKP